jgi:hypothetical protein
VKFENQKKKRKRRGNQNQEAAQQPNNQVQPELSSFSFFSHGPRSPHLPLNPNPAPGPAATSLPDLGPTCSPSFLARAHSRLGLPRTPLAPKRVPPHSGDDRAHAFSPYHLGPLVSQFQPARSGQCSRVTRSVSLIAWARLSDPPATSRNGRPSHRRDLRARHACPSSTPLPYKCPRSLPGLRPSPEPPTKP